jgi:hypothetical protein
MAKKLPLVHPHFVISESMNGALSRWHKHHSPNYSTTATLLVTIPCFNLVEAQNSAY